MMRVVFNDLRRETFTSVGGVIQIDAQCSKINGRYTNVWMLKLSNGSCRSFPSEALSHSSCRDLIGGIIYERRKNYCQTSHRTRPQ